MTAEWRTWSVSERGTLMELMRRGLTYEEIAKALNRTRSAIVAFVHRDTAIPRRYHTKGAAQLERARAAAQAAQPAAEAPVRGRPPSEGGSRSFWPTPGPARVCQFLTDVDARDFC